MKKELLHIQFLFLLFFFYASPVDAEIPAKVLSNLLQQSNFNDQLYWQKSDSFMLQFKQGLQCYTAKHNYLWYKNRLTIHLDGSGRLFQLMNNDSIVRIDNTCYEGYNFDAYNFVFNDTIFSLGGYGYWQSNSQLRFYNEKIGEWSSIQTNKNVLIRIKLFSQVYLDKENHRVFVTYEIPESSFRTKDSKDKSNVYVQCLDLYTKKWWDQEKLFTFPENIQSPSLFLKSNPIQVKQGLLFIFQNDSYILDYVHNKTYQLSKPTHNEMMDLIGTLIPWMVIPESNSITFFNSKNSTSNKIKITNANLIALPDTVYSTESSWKFNASPLLLVTSLLFMIIAYMLYHIKTLKTKIANHYSSLNQVQEIYINPNQISNNSKTPFSDNLSEIEKALLDLLISNSTNNQNTSVTQINHVMGLSKKDNRIQNNIRAATILIINKKFMAYSGAKDDLIQKERTKFDKRFFEYYILKNYIQKIK